MKYTVETYMGERSVVARQRGVIVETYACGDLSRAEAVAMAKEMGAEQDRVEIARELDYDEPVCLRVGRVRNGTLSH